MSTSIRNHLPGTIEQIVSDKVVSEIVITLPLGRWLRSSQPARSRGWTLKRETPFLP